MYFRNVMVRVNPVQPHPFRILLLLSLLRAILFASELLVIQKKQIKPWNQGGDWNNSHRYPYDAEIFNDSDNSLCQGWRTHNTLKKIIAAFGSTVWICSSLYFPNIWRSTSFPLLFQAIPFLFSSCVSRSCLSTFRRRPQTTELWDAIYFLFKQ